MSVEMTPQEAVAKIGSLETLAKGLQSQVNDQIKTNEEAASERQKMARDLATANQALAEARSSAQARNRNEGAEFYRSFVGDVTKGVKALRLEGSETGQKGFTDGLLDAPTNDDWHRELKGLVDDRSLLRAIRRDPGQPHIRPDSRAIDAKLISHLKAGPEPIAKIFSDSSGIGADFIPDVTLPRVMEDMVLARRVAALFPVLQMSNKNIKLPFMNLGGTPYLKSAPAAADPSKYRETSPGSTSRSFDAASMAVRYQMDEDALDDSIVAMLPYLRGRIVADLVAAEEDALINGDTAGTHQDAIASWNPGSYWNSSNLGGTDDHRKYCLGMRARGFDVSNTSDLSTFTTATVRGLRSSMDAPHGVAGQRVLVTGSLGYLKLVGLSDVTTMEKYGAAATIVTGELARIDGTPIVISDFVTADLHTTGLYTGASSTTSLILVNTARFLLGQYKGRTVEVSKDIRRGVFDLVATYRGTFGTFDSSTKKNIAVGINIT
jgi:HK97 family phage major capsid protein